MKQRSRKLRVETLEARRVLAAIGDHIMLDTPDMGEPGMPEMPEMPGEFDAPPMHEGDWIRPIPQEAHHFVARLRPVDDGPTMGEGELNAERPFPMSPGGIARFFLNREETLLRFRLRVPMVEGVTSADIHLGKPAEGGPAVATLFRLEAGNIRGIFIRGELDDAAIEANNEYEFDGTLAALVQRMREGNAYVEVDSQDQPDGALRGKIHPLSWRPVHNPVNRMDVNGDRDVTPLDLLTVVKDMNDNGARMVDVPLEENAPMSAPFVDVTGDNVISPQDALSLVQYLSQYGEDLLNQIGVPQEAVSETLDELQQALQFDIDAPQTIADIENRLQDILANQGVDVDALLDQVSETWETEYRDRFAEWIGQAEETAQRFGEMFTNGPSRDWSSLFDEAYRDLGDAFPLDDLPIGPPQGFPRFL